MVRTQIQLTEEQARQLRELAARRDVSLAELVRRAVQRELDAEERVEHWKQWLALAGRFSSGHSDIAERHDDYLAEDFME